MNWSKFWGYICIANGIAVQSFVVATPGVQWVAGLYAGALIGLGAGLLAGSRP